MASDAETAAMLRALELAATPGVPRGPNPRVGCVLLDADGRFLAEGYHRGAGTPHAEVAALTMAGAAARGATAVITMEPCDHTGRTGPCSHALTAAGVARVVYAQADLGPVGAGGSTTLLEAGVDVEGGLLAELAAQVNPEWSFSVTHGRPFVTWKTAATLDGRSAAADGSSRWITGPEARADVHRLRAVADAVVVGTGTVLRDDPRLTAREGGTEGPPLPYDRQPLRVVVGDREVPEWAHVRDTSAPTLFLPAGEPRSLLATLYDRNCQHVLLEGGPTLAGAFVAAALVDRVVAYVAPVLLGDGPSSLGSAGIRTLAGALRLETESVERLGDDVRITARATPGRDDLPRTDLEA
jgi:diaminohydroxyphosphoribosylaminopyrimidine deaminase/5-amino-6-(5-phosphoribosylamino)uracil reductase